MNITEARKICQDFANKHKVIFEDEGEVGFGRPCVGFLHGDSYIDFNPYTRNGNYEPIEELQCEDAYPPPGVEAYHKHDCLCVLGHGDEPIIQLAKWVKSMESAGEVKIVDYKTGATGLQAVISGLFGKAVVIE